MKKLFTLALLISSTLVFNSCYRIPDEPRKQANPKNLVSPSVSSLQQQQIETQRKQIAAQQENIRLEEISSNESTVINKTAIKETPKKEQIVKKTIEKKPSYVFATPVPGKLGFVYSPYNKKLVDVRDIPSGTLVQDPTYPEAEKKFFRVP